MPASTSAATGMLQPFTRGTGGALLFALPMMTTMELWWHGVTLPPWRIAIFVALSIPFLIGVAKDFGLEPNEGWLHHITDAFAGIVIGVVVTVALLGLFGVLDDLRTLDEWVGRIAVQALPAAFGALLTTSQFNLANYHADQSAASPGYLMLMLIGGLFMGLSLAPIEELIIVAAHMDLWRLLAIIVLSLIASEMLLIDEEHANRHGQDTASWRPYLHALIAYGLALLTSAYLLWTFGLFDHRHLPECVGLTVLLSFPVSIGAAGARLLLYGLQGEEEDEQEAPQDGDEPDSQTAASSSNQSQAPEAI